VEARAGGGGEAGARAEGSGAGGSAGKEGVWEGECGGGQGGKEDCGEQHDVVDMVVKIEECVSRYSLVAFSNVLND
jgi:hypothetical protein